MLLIRRWLGKIGYALFALIAVWVGVTSIWNGWLMPIWRDPKGTLQLLYAIGAVLIAVVIFLRVDEKMSDQSRKIAGARLLLHGAACVGAALAFLVFAFVFARGIWPAGIAAHLFQSAVEAGVLLRGHLV